ncbi:RlfB protein [Acinetobacter pittii]|nr:RlfB protein [Acinetobacter pittii]
MEHFYSFFKRDFIDSDTYLERIYINPKKDELDDGKQKVFWHLTTRTDEVWKQNGKLRQKVKERFPDLNRARRICWIKEIIENYDHNDIKLFYAKHHSSKIRLYLWAYDYDFLVILQKLGRSESILVTSFYITHDGKRKELDELYNGYNDQNSDLSNCEWF